MSQTMTAFDVCKIEGHVKSANPRHQAAFNGDGACVRCGRRMSRDEVARDLNQEREWTRLAAEFAQYVSDATSAADSLSAFREHRTGDGPWIDVSKRDWIVEALEETADLSAYLVAAMQQLAGDARDDEDADKCAMLLRIALASSVTAFNALTQYRTAEL